MQIGKIEITFSISVSNIPAYNIFIKSQLLIFYIAVLLQDGWSRCLGIWTHYLWHNRIWIL